MVNKLPRQRHIQGYIRAALEKGHLNEEEHSQIAEWLPLHPDYQPHWELCYHGHPNQQGGYGMCVYGDGRCWLTSYTKLKSSVDAYKRACVDTACRNAVRPSRDRFLADHTLGLVADHANRGGFKAIVDAFITHHGDPSVTYSRARKSYFFAPDIETMFREFHDSLVEWQAVTPEKHRKITAERKRKAIT